MKGKYIVIRDEHSKLFGHRFLNSQLSLYLGFVQLLVCLWALVQHIWAMASLNKVLHCDFSDNSTLPPLLTHVDAIIFDIGLFHHLWGITGCVAQHLDGGYGRFCWCIAHSVALLFCLPFAFTTRPRPHWLWPLLIQQSAYGVGLLILSLAALPRAAQQLGDLSNAPLQAIAFYALGTLMNFFLLYVYWHWYWHTEALWNSARKLRRGQTFTGSARRPIRHHPQNHQEDDQDHQQRSNGKVPTMMRTTNLERPMMVAPTPIGKMVPTDGGGLRDTDGTKQLNRAEFEEEDGGTKMVETKPAEPNRSPRSSVTAASTATTTITTQAQQQQQQLRRKICWSQPPPPAPAPSPPDQQQIFGFSNAIISSLPRIRHHHCHHRHRHHHHHHRPRLIQPDQFDRIIPDQHHLINQIDRHATDQKSDWYINDDFQIDRTVMKLEASDSDRQYTDQNDRTTSIRRRRQRSIRQRNMMTTMISRAHHRQGSESTEGSTKITTALVPYGGEEKSVVVRAWSLANGTTPKGRSSTASKNLHALPVRVRQLRQPLGHRWSSSGAEAIIRPAADPFFWAGTDHRSLKGGPSGMPFSTPPLEHRL